MQRVRQWGAPMGRPITRPALMAIASELVQQRRAQQVDRCGAYAVAHGGRCAAHYDDCAVLAAVASRVFRWQQAWWA
jgi:hypothetical protein